MLMTVRIYVSDKDAFSSINVPNIQRLMKLRAREAQCQSTEAKLFYKSNSLKVQADSPQDILIRRQPILNHVRVVHDISAEDEASKDGVNEINCLAEGDEDADETGHDYASIVR